MFLLGAGLCTLAVFNSATGAPNFGYLISLSALALGLLVAGGDVRLGLVVVVAIPAGALLLAPHISGRAWVLSGILGSVPILGYAMKEVTNPSWWLTSSFQEGHPLSFAAGNRFVRLPATFPGPTIAGAVALALVAILFLASSLVRGPIKAVARVGVATLMVFGAFTLTRTVIIAFVLISIGVVLGRSISTRMRVTTLLAGISIVALVAGPLWLGVSQDRSPVSERERIALASLDAWKAHPLAGIGYGQIQFKVESEGVQIYHAHFFAVQFLVELGPLGLFGISLLLVVLGRRAWPRSESRSVFLGLLLVPILDVGALLYPRSALVFWLAVALAAAFPRMMNQLESRPSLTEGDAPWRNRPDRTALNPS